MSETTMLADLINPQVMADMISAKVEEKVRIIPYAKLDTTLQGNTGDTVTIPRFKFIGEAVDVAEGEDIPIRQMGTDTAQYRIKMAGMGVELTDMAVLSGKGDPVGQANKQLADSISQKCDMDAMDALYEASTSYSNTKAISYNGVVSAIDLYEEEVNSEKVMFVHPKQTTQLRKDADFISREKYGNKVMIDGEIGMIANTRIVPSKRVKLVKYAKNASGTITIVADSTTESSTALHLSTVMKNYVGELAVGDKVNALTTNVYACPIVKLNEDGETEDELSALTYFLKRNTNVETERKSRSRKTEITADRVYCVALTNDTKVVIAKYAETASV